MNNDIPRLGICTPVSTKTSLLSRSIADTSGGVALLFAITLPAMLMVVAGALQLQMLVSDRQKTQDVADVQL
jgi:Flp pilus assembly protein TadG